MVSRPFLFTGVQYWARCLFFNRNRALVPPFKQLVIIRTFGQTFNRLTTHRLVTGVFLSEIQLSSCPSPCSRWRRHKFPSRSKVTAVQRGSFKQRNGHDLWTKPWWRSNSIIDVEYPTTPRYWQNSPFMHFAWYTSRFEISHTVYTNSTHVSITTPGLRRVV